LIAQAIHALSPRATRTMITVNMGGLSETLFESELFGHVKGAFTDAKTDRAGRFELADESTLFMDEIANIPLAQQAKLLRVIETAISSASVHQKHFMPTCESSPLQRKSGE
jgi:Transcriptional regulator containing GAF, AAA-type ATPase, and DNA binding domains